MRNYQKFWKFTEIQHISLNDCSFRAKTSPFLSCLHRFFSPFPISGFLGSPQRQTCVLQSDTGTHTRARARLPACLPARSTRTSPFPSLLRSAEGSGCWRVTTTLLCSTCLHFSRKLGLVFADAGCSKKEEGERKKKVRPRFFCFHTSHDRKSTIISEASSCDGHFYSHRCSTNDWQHFWNAQSRVWFGLVWFWNQRCRLTRSRRLIWPTTQKRKKIK